jgi:hypothetical protein
LTTPAAQSLSTADVDTIGSCSTVSAKKKSAKTEPMNEKKDLNAPKRGKNVFNNYISENLVQVKKENPTASSWGDIISTIASTHHPVLLLRANIIIVM